MYSQLHIYACVSYSLGFEPVGRGCCRDSMGRVPTHNYKYNTTKERCTAQCKTTERCMAFTFRESSGGAPNACLLWGMGMNCAGQLPGFGCVAKDTDATDDITHSDGQTGAFCYRKTAPKSTQAPTAAATTPTRSPTRPSQATNFGTVGSSA